MIIGTAGHIDHGKSALVKALTGVDPDRLPEEKARGITLDLGFAYLPLPTGQTLGFVDVPGHEKLVHNMLAGATGIDFALLVIAADDGPMPQTLEHLQLLTLLGIGRGVIALTKVDRVSTARLQQAHVEAQQCVRGSTLERAPIFPLAAPFGTGVAELREFLQAEARKDKFSTPGRFRFTIDRAFSVTGAGTVVTGTVLAGEVRIGDTLVLSPQGVAVRVRSLHAQSRAAPQARAGERCGINIAGAELEHANIRRGNWLVDATLHAPTRCVDAVLELVATQSKPFRHWTQVHIHHGAAEVTGRIALLETDALEPGWSALAQLVLDAPLCALHGDRYIVRDQAARATLGGGRVLNPDAAARQRRGAENIARLRALQLEDPKQRLRALLDTATEGCDLVRLARAWNCAPEDMQLDQVRIACGGGEQIALAETHWLELRRRCLDLLADFHRQAPDEIGPDKSRLRRMLCPRASATLLDKLLEALHAEKAIAKTGPWLHLPSHSTVLADAERALADRILALLAQRAYDPPWVRAIASQLALPEDQIRSLLRRLARAGEVFQIVPDLFYRAHAIVQLARIAQELEAQHGGISAGKFRDAVGVGRKRAIQILEFFDRVGYTRRARDVHRVRATSLLEWR